MNFNILELLIPDVTGNYDCCKIKSMDVEFNLCGFRRIVDIGLKFEIA